MQLEANQIRGESMKCKIRKPTSQELEQLKAFLSEEAGQDTAETENLIRNYYFIILEGYISDCPGYRGKLLFAVYGVPEFHELYGWNGDKLIRIEQDIGIKDY